MKLEIEICDGDLDTKKLQSLATFSWLKTCEMTTTFCCRKTTEYKKFKKWQNTERMCDLKWKRTIVKFFSSEMSKIVFQKISSTFENELRKDYTF